jgi:tryptophanyl-tRNA synthetase
VILGLDGIQKMSKSRNNAIMLKATPEETVNLIKKAKTDSNRVITYDPSSRPEVSNLLLLASLASNEAPEKIAEGIGDSGSGKLKQIVTERLNDYLAPIRKRRNELAANMDHVKSVLRNGISHTRCVAEKTLSEVRAAMNMEI